MVAWINKLSEQKFVVSSRDFVEFLGRLSFVAQLLIWLKPHLAPLFAWSSVIARSTVGRLPETVIVTLKYILLELEQESFMVSTRRPLKYLGDQFRTDAKCNDGLVILAGGNSSPGVGSHCVFTPGMPHIFSNPTVSHSGHPLLQS